MRQIAVLVAVLLLALIFNSLTPKSGEQQLDRATVEKFILEDAKVTYGEDAEYSIVKFAKTDGKWNVELDITSKYSQPQQVEGSFCSKTMRRYYTLFPIVFREELYKNTC
ncbi:MAG: hypothetical protein V1835_02050 [Candidatus Micrarchaeota archaeon]